MIVKIDEKEFALHFGFASLEYLDRVYYVNYGDVPLGLGVEMLMANLKMGNVLSLFHLIKAGTCTEKEKPSNQGIEELVGGMNEKQLDDFFEEAMEELKKQPLTKVKATEQSRNMEKAIEKAEQKKKDEE